MSFPDVYVDPDVVVDNCYHLVQWFSLSAVVLKLKLLIEAEATQIVVHQ